MNTIENSEGDTGAIQDDAGSAIDTGEEVPSMPDGEQDGDLEESQEIKALRQARDDNAQKARQAAEREAYWRGIAEANLKQPQQSVEEDYDPEELVTRAELDKMRREDTLRQQDAAVQERVRVSFASAKEKYKNDPILNWEQVEAKAQELLANGVWTERTLYAIRETPNAGETLYTMIAAQPDILEKFKTAEKKAAVEQTVDIINRTQNQPGTISNVSGGGSRVISEAQRYQNMSSAEILAEAQKVERGG